MASIAMLVRGRAVKMSSWVLSAEIATGGRGD
jgi:hypothetical protein